MGSLVDLTGQRFGHWTVLAKAGRGRGLTRWSCRCDCGTARAVIGIHLRQGRSLSCGCVNRKLTAAEVRSIRLDKRTQMALAADYGVAQSVISRIKSAGRTATGALTMPTPEPPLEDDTGDVDRDAGGDRQRDDKIDPDRVAPHGH